MKAISVFLLVWISLLLVQPAYAGLSGIGKPEKKTMSCCHKEGTCHKPGKTAKAPVEKKNCCQNGPCGSCTCCLNCFEAIPQALNPEKSAVLLLSLIQFRQHHHLSSLLSGEQWNPPELLV